MSLSDVKKEQIKLRATFLNGMGIGVMLIGVLTPTTRLIYGDLTAQVSAVWLVVSPLACFGLGLGLHLSGARALEGLKR
ncbi:MAG: hypothetical protein KJ947_16510 [Alphaproteobacteria bacterium]|jgi:hypothetical protein|nr:hypothetical protein [Alphaproteobacteria bacterium]MBU1551162.1 hypothetical protein [Alphaproteobacteria bacterium]MBU2334969.1 hypothetical protein [Alphaproteobacteria bacterium]MBU2388841.1 hypothetical protein [Alphaproteobacteria bacterium]MDY6963244.1 hypothetical protein [Pseudomonadota bacterium]